ncbi:MAG: hypothetical protein IKG18_16505 [Atopobiaceae bacterium]|nr:hypothetical protein [Atopobiaceae bacterium]
MRPRRQVAWALALALLLVDLCLTTSAGMALGPVWGAAILVVQVSVIAFVALTLLPREARGAATVVSARDEENDATRVASESADAPCVVSDATPPTEASSSAAQDGHTGSERPATSSAMDEDQPKADVPGDDSAESEPTSVQEPEAEPARADGSTRVADAADDDQVPQTSTEQDSHAFTIEDFSAELLTSQEPMEYLADFCESTAQDAAAVPLARFLMRRLTEADIASWRLENAPHVDVVLLQHSGMFYLRAPARLEYGRQLQILRIEAALNAVRFAIDYYDEPCDVSEEDLMRLEQRHANSICAQVSDVTSSDWSYLAMPWQTPWGPSERGEWAVRSSLSESLETLSVPYRLEASFRSNVSGGDVAIEVAATPARVFPRTAFVDGLGIIPTTSHMRSREASRYAARIGILLANCAFRSSERIHRVWVASIEVTPTSRICRYWVRLDRRPFSRVRMDAVSDPLDALERLGATMSLEHEVLQPVGQGFYLEDERFCPPLRHDLWQLSERSLPPGPALHLGASRVSGLNIHEELPRVLAADEALRGMGAPSENDATRKYVRSILDAASKTSDVTVWCAAERVATKLVDGTLALDNQQLLRDELISGDELSRAVGRAQELLTHEKHEEALTLLQSALAPLDKVGAYQDTRSTVYRSFDTFAQRALYNRLNAQDDRCVVLVPDAYVVAHLLLTGILLARSTAREEMEPDASAATAHAQRALEVAPLSTSAFLGNVACLERTQALDEAAELLVSMLEVAHDPQGVALAYYRMASIQWQLGHHKASIACYQLAAGILPLLIPTIMAECHALSSVDPIMGSPLEASEVEAALSEQAIPVAPTPRMSFLLYDCATASVDAEVFPLARDLMGILESFTGDDIIHGIRNSLECEPDV